MVKKLFKSLSTISKCQALERFETLRRPSHMSLEAFLDEFDKRLYKLNPMALYNHMIC